MNRNQYPLLVLFFVSCLRVFAQDTLKTSVYFETASYLVSDFDITKLTKFKKELGEAKITAVLLKGYTDDVGSFKNNNILSKNRALEVKEQLGRLDFPISRNDRTEGLGPIALKSQNNNVIEQRKNNRRVDVIVIYESPTITEELKVPPIAIIKSTETVEISTKKLSSSLKVGDKVLMKNLIFVGGRDILRNENNPDLDSLVKFLNDNPKHKITILGHVCCVNTGQDGFNTETETRTLSVDRAKKIYEMLAARGIERTRMSYRGLKALYPTGLGEVADRRVEIQIADIEE